MRSQFNVTLPESLISEVRGRAIAESANLSALTERALRAYLDTDQRDRLDDHETRIRRLEGMTNDGY